MTIQELAKQYVLEIIKDSSTQSINEIIAKINSLTYEDSDKTISQETIDKLINEIQIVAGLEDDSATMDDISNKYESLITENTSTSEFNEIVRLITRGTKK